MDNNIKKCVANNYKLYYSDNHEILLKIKKLLDEMDNNYFTKTTLNEKVLDKNTISIVMTSCDRSVQTYFTLKTISQSLYKNIQIIIVDDSTSDLIDIEKLKEFNLHIDFIQIKNKFWINPCVGYNIGFRHVKGGKIIIQNAEVCHIGDVIQQVNDKVIDNNYYVFNVYAFKGLEENNELYEAEKNNIMNPSHVVTIYGQWYQHSQHRCVNLHFLTAITAKTFEKIIEFDIDYAIAIDYDDNDLIYRITTNNINIINMPETIMGVHQWHRQTSSGSGTGRISNIHIFYKKINYFNINKSFLKLTSFNNNNDAMKIIEQWL